ncbi:MAG TPA: hypothetical protein VJA21_00285 [Verrucomicrobiae bacterium]
MKAKHLFLAIAALLAAGGLWLARSAWRAHAFHQSSMGVSVKMPHGQPKPGVYVGGGSLSTQLPASGQSNSVATMAREPTPATEQRIRDRVTSGQTLNSPARLAPPVPNRRFTDFTPEQRVQFARQGHGPGG